MSSFIYKFPIPVSEKFTLDLPRDADIIRIDDVDGWFFAWVLLNPEEEKVPRFFECYKTGQPIETSVNALKYLGHFKMFIMQELCLYLFENLHEHA
jgi:hypothetical protein